VQLSRSRRPPVRDLLVAGGLLIAALVEIWVTHAAQGPRGAGTAVAVLSTVPLAWRRSFPPIAVGGAVAAIMLPMVLQPVVETDGLAVLIAWLVAVHAVNAYSSVRTAAAGTLAVLVPVTYTTATMPAPPGQPAGNVVWGLGLFGAAAAAGQVMRRQALRLARERVAGEAQARAEERRRLARELHDVVAHGVAVMVVQAGAAQQLVHEDPDHAWSLLEAVQRTGEQSAGELRRMLALLGGKGPGLDPQPGLADLPDLIAQVRACGLPVDFNAPPLQVDVATGLQVTGYRVVQEALTNALKHGPRSAVSVNVRSDRGFLTLTIEDQANIAVGDRASAGGQGLLGLQERVGLYGGTLQAGPKGSSWKVHASLPILGNAPPANANPVPATEPHALS
jgi:signal transduction histidine kinase